MTLFRSVDRKYNEIVNDPRLQPITVYEILEIEMPVDGGDSTMAEQLLTARAADAMQYRRAFKGCRSARQAASGIRSEEHTSEHQSLMRTSYAVFCLRHKNQNHTTI